jgi:RNA polymerase sigma factor (sigma-70 family)
MAAEDQRLLAAFLRENSQDAFTALVRRHLNLVYSAALRQVRSPELAEEISQTVFLNLARNAARLKSDTILAAWLYQVTRNAAIDVIRREAARQAREQIAVHMNSLNDSPAAWSDIEPFLDDAMDALDATDRSALLLRYFENKSLREVGEAIGASEDAAQKRVTRALEKLRDQFAKRKITVSAAAVAGLLSVNAVQAAPAGLVLTVAASSGAALATISTVAVSKTIALTMTATQKTIAATIIAIGAITVGVYEMRDASQLRAEVQTLREHQQETAALTQKIQTLQTERDQAVTQVAALKKENAVKTPQPNEALKLRGEVSQLRQEKRDLGATSGLSKATANPEAKRMMREQQKMGMSMIYKSLGKDLKLTDEQTEKFSDALADHIMANVENVTVALRQKMSVEQADQVFANQEATLQANLQQLLGADGLAKYNEHTRDIMPNITSEQFKAMMSGDDEAKKKKAAQMSKILKEETQAVLTANNLPADYQVLPMLNFRNIAYEAEGEKSVQLMEQIYSRAGDRFGDVLDKDELKKFIDLKSKAASNNRGALTMNRALMAPIGD